MKVICKINNNVSVCEDPTGCELVAFGSFLRMKKKDEKPAFLGYFIAGTIGGVTEPALYGVGLKYKKPFIGMFIGGFCGGLAGLTHVSISIMSASNVLGFSSSSINLINGCIVVGIAFVVATVVVYFTGIRRKTVLIILLPKSKQYRNP